MRVLIALGGNALLRRGEPLDASHQGANAALAARAIGRVARHHAVVVTHGNGPQVGLLALQAEAGPGGGGWPLDVLGAESEGMIGYQLEQALRNALPGRQLATLLTQVLVERGDPAFVHPTKPIGPVYDAAEARRLAAERGWTVAADGDGFRRVVPSPEPLAVVETSTIRLLLDAGVLVVCAGGGGIPVALGAGGGLHGVEAVVDKDLASALLARELGVDALLLLTDVDGVFSPDRDKASGPIRAATAAELRALALPAGSMGPKVEAACRFVEASAGMAAIGSLADAAAVLRGERGTRVLAAS